MSICAKTDRAFVLAAARHQVPMPDHIAPDHDFAVSVSKCRTGTAWKLTCGPYQSGFEKACASIG